MTFDELEFTPHLRGVRSVSYFANGYGASVVKFPGSYGFSDGLYEIAVIHCPAGEWKICYDTPITGDVLGHLSESDVTDILEEIETLPMI